MSEHPDVPRSGANRASDGQAPAPAPGRFRRAVDWSGLAGTVVVAAVLSACGGNVSADGPVTAATGNALPAGTVAEVGGKPVTAVRYAVQQRLTVYEATILLVGAEGLSASGFRLLPVNGTPDDCVRWIRRYAPERKIGTVDDAKLRRTCESTLSGLRATVVGQLLAAEVDAAEASAVGARVDQDAFDQQLENVYAGFGGSKNLSRFTKVTGITDQDLRARLRQVQLGAAVQERVVERAGTTVTEADLRRYFAESPRLFTAEAEKRDVSVLIAPTRASAEQLKRQIESGETFAAAAKDPSVTAPSRRADARFVDVKAKQLPPELRELVFSAALETVSGPTRAGDGWAVLRVDRVVPARQASLATSRPALRRLVPARKPLWAWNDHQSDVVRRWRSKIVCAEDYDEAPLCGNSRADLEPASEG